MSFQATATTTGNSKALRIDAALYQAHPEFASGSFEVDVIAPGRMLVRSQAASETNTEDDPIFSTFLAFLTNEVIRTPEAVTPLTGDTLQRAASLVANMAVDPNEAFPDDFQLP